MRRVLVFLEQLDKVAHGRRFQRRLVALLIAASVCGFGQPDHVLDKLLQIPDRLAQIDGIVDGADYGFVSGNNVSDGLGEVVWSGFAQDFDELFAVADG